MCIRDSPIPVPTKRDAEQIVKLLQQAPEIECQVLLALTCSLRQSEIAAITPFDVNGRVIRVHGARIPNENNKLVYKETNKSKAGTRTVIMPDYLAAKMARRCLDCLLYTSSTAHRPSLSAWVSSRRRSRS